MSRSHDTRPEASAETRTDPGRAPRPVELDSEPDFVGEGQTTSALVPAAAPRRGRLARWLQRVTEVAPARSAVVPQELFERLDGLEVALAAHEEQTAKRLEENEGRTLHLLEQRIAVLEGELASSLARRAEREVRTQLAPLRSRIAIVALVALAAGAVGSFALLEVTGSVPF